MRKFAIVAWAIGFFSSAPLRAEDESGLPPPVAAATDAQPTSAIQQSSATEPMPEPVAAAPHPPVPAEALSWHTMWGLTGIRIIPAGVKTAPNGSFYHPNFSMDLDFNFWLWPSQGLYLFGEARLWGERSENGVTNARDGFLGTSKREFDLFGGLAWNYGGAWEARAFGYTQNNLNRGVDPLTPEGFNDGFGIENRYYLSAEYAKLGQTGFDVARATFVSIGYYPSKSMIGNDGQQFQPGLMLRGYLIYDLWDLPSYLFADVTYIGERSFQPRLLIFDLGIAVRPFHGCQQCEFRLGAENTGDFHVHNVQNLWYASVRYIY
jgi:hypothetical protein